MAQMWRQRARPAGRRLLLVTLFGTIVASAGDFLSGGSGSKETLEVDDGEGPSSQAGGTCDPGMEERFWTVDGLTGAKYLAGVGIGISGDRLTLKHNSGTSLVSKCKSHYGPWDLIQLRLVEGSISFTVDLGKVGCACNLAFYLVSAPARDVDGIPIAGNSTLAPGNYYCDANKVGGQWCPEVDIMEANNHAFQATPHKCDPMVGDRHYTHCDGAGCAQNTKYQNQAYGPGAQFGINTLLPFRVETEFAGQDGKLSGMTTTLRQHDHQVVLDHSNCDPGYYAALSQAMVSGMSLRVTYWGSDAKTMAWMDDGPCGGQVCKGDSAGEAVISNVVVRSSPVQIRNPGKRQQPQKPVKKFDCSKGLSNWQKGWSPLKVCYCCEHGGSSCAATQRRKGQIKWSNHPNKCLTVARAAGSTTIKPEDYSLIIWDCQPGDVGASQGFVSHGDGLIRWEAHPEICMDVGGPFGTRNGTYVRFAKCIGPNEDSSGQTFKFPSSSARIQRQVYPNVCLDIANHSGINGNRVQLWKCIGDDDDQVLTWAVDGPESGPAPVPAPSPAPASVPPPPVHRSQPPAPAPQPAVTPGTAPAPRTYNCVASSDSAREDWSYRQKLWCCRHWKQGCPVRIPAVWVYDPVVPYPAHVRTEPKFDGLRTNTMLEPGDTFRVSQGVEGSDGILYLKLADGTGWFFDRMPGVGVMSVEYRVAKTSTSHFSCAIWYPGIEDSWPEKQKRFCCQHAGRGCPAQQIRSSTPLILHEPIQQSQRSTAGQQRQSNPQSPMEYDCNVDYQNAETAWPPEQRSWCCLHRGTGCVTTTGLMPSAIADSDCQEGQGWGWRSSGCRKQAGSGLGSQAGGSQAQAAQQGGSGTVVDALLIVAGCACLAVGAGLLFAKEWRPLAGWSSQASPERLVDGAD